MTHSGTAKPAAAFFDFDMTLADSAESVLAAINLFASEMGLRAVAAKDLMAAIGLTLEESWVSYWGRCEPWWLEYYRGRYGDRELSGIRPFPDAIPVLERVRGAGVKTAVVTNRDKAREAVERAGLGAFFDAVVGAEEAERPKPAPDPVLKAMELLGVAADAAVFVGDSHLDIQAAVAAGVKGIGVSTGGTSASELAEAGAWKVCGRLGEVPEIIGIV
ncbi:MAG: HAD-IA family hydrolase [Deltaproteobacteria bacterium]|jgi:HAD superfamily hydrolase (TIGR01509 family)|nr:HAD-IA family hydrolase [Deltaproteobacteria bacterium]